MGEVKAMERDVTKINEAAKLPLSQVPNNIKMPEQLTEDELRQEVSKLRNIIMQMGDRLKQADSKIQELSNAWGIKRLELLFNLLSNGSFPDEINEKVRIMICEDLGVTDVDKEDENK